MKKLTTQPYISELSTLTALFSRILTFAVITKNIPTIADIRSYSFSFTNIDYRQGAVPVTAIMFFHKTLFRDACGTPVPSMDLRRLFDPPDVRFIGSNFKAMS